MAPSGRPRAANPARLLGELAVCTRFADSLDDLIDSATSCLLDLLSADAIHVSRIDLRSGELRVLRNAGRRRAWQEELPAGAAAALDRYPQVRLTAERALPRSGGVDDPETHPTDRQLMRQTGTRWAASLIVYVAGEVWGELLALRSGRREFGPDELALGDTVATLFAAGVTRLEHHELLQRLVYEDALTGLANRRAVDDRLGALLDRDGDFPTVSAVLCDVNGLKAVNDALGHDAGDNLLRRVGGLVREAAARLDGALAARMGGDEFAIVADGPSEDAVAGVVQQLATTAAGLPYGSGLSCGLAATTRRPPSATTPETAVRALLRLADAAQYRQKTAARAFGAAATAPEVAFVPGQSRAAADSLSALTASSLRALADQRAASVEQRLALVAEHVTKAVDAAAWWVSSVDGDALIDRMCGTLRESAPLDEPTEPVQVDSAARYVLADYPATAAASAGGSFYADMYNGDASERSYLAAQGYRAVVGAGGPDTTGLSWVVEVYADALTPALEPLRHVLHPLVQVALAGSLAGAVLTPHQPPAAG